MIANCCAASELKGRMRRVKSSSNIDLAAFFKAVRRFPSGKISKP